MYCALLFCTLFLDTFFKCYDVIILFASSLILPWPINWLNAERRADMTPTKCETRQPPPQPPYCHVNAPLALFMSTG